MVSMKTTNSWGLIEKDFKWRDNTKTETQQERDKPSAQEKGEDTREKDFRGGGMKNEAPDW